jgi:hypothetical protein
MHGVCTWNKDYKAAFDRQRVALLQALFPHTEAQSMPQSLPLNAKGYLVSLVASTDHMHLSHAAFTCV